MGRGKRKASARALPVACQGPLLVGLSKTESELVSRARLALSPDLLKGIWRVKNAQGHPMTGHCYVATEALYHLLGGKEAGWKSMMMSFDNDCDWGPVELPHWWLENVDGRRIDATSDQFASPVPYERGRHKAFITNEKLGDKPSKRARILIARLEG